jgi:glucuronate isomerase
MAKPLRLHPERLFPSDPAARAVASRLYAEIRDLPIISPHGHTDPAWFAENAAWTDPTSLLLAPDHYIYRMLYSQGIPLEKLGVPSRQGPSGADPREAWHLFASNFHLFRGTPSSMWLNHVFGEVFGFTQALSSETADDYYDGINAALATPAFRPRALFDRFRIALLATTEGAVDELPYHRSMRAEGWQGNVVTTYRPDSVVDPEHEEFATALVRFGDMTGEDVESWDGYLRAHRKRRADFMAMGATASDHGHPTAATADLSRPEVEALFAKVVAGKADAADAELFRAQMLTEMARMSLDDGLVMQIHPGSFRNHNQQLFASYGRDKGADIPRPTDYVHALRPLLGAHGNDPRLSIILFTLDETVYARELAPLAGHYPCLTLGPAWWFHDSPEGMRRFREQVTETAGFYNTAGFNDDTRAFLSIPARHDVARRVDCAFLARLVTEQRLDEDEAAELAFDLTWTLPRRAYRLNNLPANPRG